MLCPAQPKTKKARKIKKSNAQVFISLALKTLTEPMLREIPIAADVPANSGTKKAFIGGSTLAPAPEWCKTMG